MSNETITTEQLQRWRAALQVTPSAFRDITAVRDITAEVISVLPLVLDEFIETRKMKDALSALATQHYGVRDRLRDENIALERERDVLLDQLRALHDQVDQTNPHDPVGVALTRAGAERRPDGGELRVSPPIPRDPVLTDDDRQTLRRIVEHLVASGYATRRGGDSPALALLDKLLGGGRE